LVSLGEVIQKRFVKTKNMKDLIKALTILLKYGNPSYPTHCEHDELSIHGIDPEKISKEDVKQLKDLGFEIDIEGVYDEENEYEAEENRIYSYKYGSC
tara:strand:- start:162 stop:455 length:294 start_codon:yes stop_codon:yes gene_type:complete